MNNSNSRGNQRKIDEIDFLKSKIEDIIESGEVFNSKDYDRYMDRLRILTSETGYVDNLLDDE